MQDRPHPVAVIENLPISLDSHETVLAEIGRAVAAGEKGRYISITNTESMYHGMRIQAHGDYIRGADFSLCDGVGVIIPGWFWGYEIHRFNGPILQLDCSREGASRGWRHFYYGGKEGVAEEMARRLGTQFPGLNVCGTYTPPFRALSDTEKDDIIRRINATKPDIVWVGLGLLKQESWIAAHLGRIDATWMIGVGGAFDYHSGNIPWAPAPVRALGLEWLYRLILQPRLRAKRMWWSMLFFLRASFDGIVGLRFRAR